ncbi:nuclear transport factor 2 family protein [Mycobacterium montefiorense]|uniref:nuclear transport factor 2 family protein n=1 Tax=Mycobacterium montefiorense TaxID=154654 RepID=UPI0027E14DB6|nr:nuclear transport factor 2 family protein [Mycobacterium montefiorense]MCV7426022.1 nuclear transport factor 2 family protein [Mycobacterium montefiorense]
MVVDEAKLALMLDRDELHALVAAYCRAVDRADYETLRSLYHPEATDAHGSFSSGGVEQFIAQLQAAEPYVRVSQHNITTTNFVVEGDGARGEIYCLVFHTFAGPEHDIDVVIGGRYLDTYIRHDGRWKFLQRTIIADWAYQNDPSQLDFEHPSTRGSLRGKPGQADPSVSLLRSRQS